MFPLNLVFDATSFQILFRSVLSNSVFAWCPPQRKDSCSLRWCKVEINLNACICGNSETWRRGKKAGTGTSCGNGLNKTLLFMWFQHNDLIFGLKTKQLMGQTYYFNVWAVSWGFSSFSLKAMHCSAAVCYLILRYQCF